MRVARRQRPDRVHMVRQHDESVDFKRIFVARATASRSEPIWSTSRVLLRSSRLTVKNQQPPGTKARR
jgi:hypothetical protein